MTARALYSGQKNLIKLIYLIYLWPKLSNGISIFCIFCPKKMEASICNKSQSGISALIWLHLHFIWYVNHDHLQIKVWNYTIASHFRLTLCAYQIKIVHASGFRKVEYQLIKLSKLVQYGSANCLKWQIKTIFQLHKVINKPSQRVQGSIWKSVESTFPFVLSFTRHIPGSFLGISSTWKLLERSEILANCPLCMTPDFSKAS